MPEISDEELEQFNRYKELGTPDEISGGLTERQQLTRERVVNEAAQIAGFKPTVLAKLSEGIDLQVKDGAATIGNESLEEYAKTHWAEFLPSLKAEGGSAVPFVRQPVKSVQPSNNVKQVVTSYVKRTYGKSQAAAAN